MITAHAISMLSLNHFLLLDCVNPFVVLNYGIDLQP